MALQQMIDEKNTFLFVSRICPVFTRANFVLGTFEDCPVWDKVCKIATNYHHLLSVGYDRKFV